MTIELRLSSVSVLLSWLWLDFLASSSFSLDFLSVLLMAHSRRRHKYASSTAMAAKNPPTVTTIGIVPDLSEKTVAMGLVLLLWLALGVVSVGIPSTLVELLPVIGVSLVRLFGVVELVLAAVVGVTPSSFVGSVSSELSPRSGPGIFGGGGG